MWKYIFFDTNFNYSSSWSSIFANEKMKILSMFFFCLFQEQDTLFFSVDLIIIINMWFNNNVFQIPEAIGEFFFQTVQFFFSGWDNQWTKKKKKKKVSHGSMDHLEACTLIVNLCVRQLCFFVVVLAICQKQKPKLIISGVNRHESFSHQFYFINKPEKKFVNNNNNNNMQLTKIKE